MSQIKLVVYQWTDLIKTLLAMYFGQKNILYRGRNSAGILIIGIVVSFFYHWLGAGGWFLVAPIAKNFNRPLGLVCAEKRAWTQRMILCRQVVFQNTIPSYTRRNSLILMPTNFFGITVWEDVEARSALGACQARAQLDRGAPSQRLATWLGISIQNALISVGSV